MALSDLTPEQRKLIERTEQNKPEYKQLQVVSDIALMCEELIRLADDRGEKGDKLSKELGAVLVDMRESLKSLNKKEAPDTPDYAKPVVERLKQLETALTGALKKIDVRPVVNSPQVNVDAPSVHVDLKGVEKVLKEMPKAFKEAIRLIPKTEIPEDDYSPIISKLSELSEKLDSIDTASRMKPQFPNTLKVTNVDGSGVTSSPTTIRNGKKTVTTAGTRVRLTAADTPVQAVIIRALSANTGTIYIGDAVVSSTNGHTIVAGESVGMAIDNLNKIYLDCSVNGEGITYLGG